MSGGASSGYPATNAAPFTVDNSRDKEYCVYTSMQNINGHRMSYINNDNDPG